MKTKILGRQILIEYYDCDRKVINDLDQLRVALLEAARKSGATIVTDVFHTFSPQGVSGVVVIAESHIAIHTWPEYGCASVDIFSCSPKMKPEKIEGFLKEIFRAGRVESTEIKRGKIPLNGLINQELTPEQPICDMPF